MNTEEATRPATSPEELHFDAHEFDGLRDEIVSVAETWLAPANRFVRRNPWLCVALAVAAGCALGSVLCRRESDEESPKEA